MMTPALQKIHRDNLRKEPLVDFAIGDIVRVHFKIREGDKERIQVFIGTVIARRGTGATETFTVRRIGAHGIGVERVFPIHSPRVEKVERESRGRVRRAKLYYLRERSGKKARVRRMQS